MTYIGLKIQGPGPLRVLQEANSNKKDVSFFVEPDEKGNPLRVGYYIKNIGEHNVPISKIVWFSPEEVIVKIDTPIHKLNQSSLNIEFSHPKENERHFLISLTLDRDTRIIMRNLFRIQKNSVIGFVIQIEIHYVSDGQSIGIPIVRYDHAHGFFHRDIISSSGKKTKHRIEIEDTRGAIVFAFNELRKDLNLWLNNLGYSMLEERVQNQPKLDSEIENAKNKLLELHDNPAQIENTPSTYVYLADTIVHDAGTRPSP